MSVRSLRLLPAVAILGLGLPLLSMPPATAVAGSRRAPGAHLGDCAARGERRPGGVRVRRGLPTTVLPEWVDTLVHDGSGLPVRVAGAKVLSVSMNGAVAHDASGATVSGRTAFALPNVITAVGAGDFEGSVLFGLGVQKQTSFHVRVQATGWSSTSAAPSRRASARSTSQIETRTGAECSVGCPPSSPRRGRCAAVALRRAHRR